MFGFVTESKFQFQLLLKTEFKYRNLTKTTRIAEKHFKSLSSLQISLQTPILNKFRNLYEKLRGKFTLKNKNKNLIKEITTSLLYSASLTLRFLLEIAFCSAAHGD